MRLHHFGSSFMHAKKKKGSPSLSLLPEKKERKGVRHSFALNFSVDKEGDADGEECDGMTKLEAIVRSNSNTTSARLLLLFVVEEQLEHNQCSSSPSLCCH